MFALCGFCQVAIWQGMSAGASPADGSSEVCMSTGSVKGQATNSSLRTVAWQGRETLCEERL